MTSFSLKTTDGITLSECVQTNDHYNPRFVFDCFIVPIEFGRARFWRGLSTQENEANQSIERRYVYRCVFGSYVRFDSTSGDLV